MFTTYPAYDPSTTISVLESAKLVFVGKIIDLQPIEGVVIRSQQNEGHAPISFKVINLNLEK